MRLTSKRSVLLLALAACAGVAAWQSASAGVAARGGRSAAPLTKVSLRLDWVAQGYQAPFYAALGLGYYKQAGLDVSIKDGRGTSTTIRTVANGSDNFGFGQLSEVAVAIANQGIPLKAVGGVFEAMPDAVFVRQGRGIRTLKDLAGKQVITSASDSSRTFFPALAAANGFDASKVKLLNVSSESKTRVFIAGRGDAMLNFASEAFAVKKGGVQAKLFRYADNGINVISQGLFTSSDYIKKNAAAVRAFVRASMRGVAYAKNHPTQAVKWNEKYRKGAESQSQALFELKASLPLLTTKASRGKPLGYMAPGDWAQSIKLLRKYQKMKRVPANTLYTNRFVG
jgi:NitT/TauT family transport system substrate-binding protein